MSALNKAQRIIADSYAGGEYSHLREISLDEDFGDTLFLFLMRETADSDCDKIEEAYRRLRGAVGNIAECLHALGVESLNERLGASNDPAFEAGAPGAR